MGKANLKNTFIHKISALHEYVHLSIGFRTAKTRFISTDLFPPPSQDNLLREGLDQGMNGSK